MKHLEPETTAANSRRALLGRLAALGLAAWSPLPRAQPAFPTKPLRLLVPAGPGSAPDLRARQIERPLADALGQPVVVENRPGANGAIAAREAARSAPDGHTLFLGGIALVLNDILKPDPAMAGPRAFQPVTLVGAAPMLLVAGPRLDVRVAADVVALAQREPGRVSYASYGPGSLPQLTAMAFERAAGIRLLEVPYKSQAQEMPDLISGEVALSLTFLVAAAPHLASGRLRVLAVASASRLAALPDAPTFAELGWPDVQAKGWQGIFVPQATPQPVVQRLHAELARILRAPDLLAQWRATGAEPGGNTPEEFAALVRDEAERWGEIIRTRGIKPA